MSASKAGGCSALTSIAREISTPAIPDGSPPRRRVIMARNKSGDIIRRDQDGHTGPEAYTPPEEAEARPVAEQAAPEPAELLDRSDYFATRLRETALPLFLGANLGRAMP